jgi:hypothetical protein
MCTCVLLGVGSQWFSKLQSSWTLFFIVIWKYWKNIVLWYTYSSATTPWIWMGYLFPSLFSFFTSLTWYYSPGYVLSMGLYFLRGPMGPICPASETSLQPSCTHFKWETETISHVSTVFFRLAHWTLHS